MTIDTRPRSTTRALALTSIIAAIAGFALLVSSLIVLATSPTVQLPEGDPDGTLECGRLARFIMRGGTTSLGGEHTDDFHDAFVSLCATAQAPLLAQFIFFALGAIALFVVAGLTRLAAFRAAKREAD
jgi:ABC-type Na+ efflux pump permease subunit